MTPILRRILPILGLAVLVAAPAPSEEGAASRKPAGDGPQIRWSMTGLIDFHVIDMEDGPDDVGGFFDQYDFTPNKPNGLLFELGVNAASLDLIGAEDTPALQIRFFSPTSNLGVSGDEINEPFFNQRLDAFGRRGGVALDLQYHRFRTEDLRIFPNTEGGPLVFHDRTRPHDRFTRERTGFETTLRIRPVVVFDVNASSFMSRLGPEISFRGGYENRDGLNQLVFLRTPTNDWLGLRQQMDRSVVNLGGGVLIAPWGRVNVMLDFDHERFRFNSGPILQGQLGFAGPAASRTVGFIPNTDRSTGTARISAAVGERVRLSGGLQISHLEQVHDLTPDEQTAGLNENRITTHAANASVDVQILDDLSLETSFKFNRRNNRIERPTPLFSPSNGTQIDEFVKSRRRYVVRGELVYRLSGANSVAVGARYEDISRDIEFAQVVPGNRRIVPANALIAEDTRMTTVYGRTVLHPFQGLRLSGEVGYRDAPRTGYIVDLDDYVYGRMRVSYAIPLSRVVFVSAYVNGSTGQNDDFEMVSGAGANPPGPPLGRNFERATISGGLTLSGSPVDRLSLFASLFVERNDQKSSLTLSTLPRYYQDDVPIVFSGGGTARYHGRRIGLSIGGHYRVDDLMDADLDYTFTHVDARYGNGLPGSPLRLVSSNTQIDSETHAIHIGLRRKIRAGLVVAAGYGLQIYVDHSPVPVSAGSIVTPFDPSMLQHRGTLSMTLTQDLFDGGQRNGGTWPTD